MSKFIKLAALAFVCALLTIRPMAVFRQASSTVSARNSAPKPVK